MRLFRQFDIGKRRRREGLMDAWVARSRNT